MPAISRPTSKDVAQEAGVSQSTVSLVLGGKWSGRVSPATARSVRSAAERLGYRPNQAAGLGQVLGKLSMDAVVQREIGEEMRSSTFAVSETLHQLSWVLGGLLGLGMSIVADGRVALAVVAAALALAFGLLLSRQASTHHREHHPGRPTTIKDAHPEMHT